MTNILKLSCSLQKWLYKTATIRFIRNIAILAQVALYATLCFGYGLHLRELMVRYGMELVVLAFIPYLLMFILMLLLCLIFGNYRLFQLTAFLLLVPTMLLTEVGVELIINYLWLGVVIQVIEFLYRKWIVTVVSGFSQRFSPLYEKRKGNQKKYTFYDWAYAALEYVTVEDFTLIKEEETIEKQIGSQLPRRFLKRTFKIRGVIGKVTVQDSLLIAPQRKSFWQMIRGRTM